LLHWMSRPAASEVMERSRDHVNSHELLDSKLFEKSAAPRNSFSACPVKSRDFPSSAPVLRSIDVAASLSVEPSTTFVESGSDWILLFFDVLRVFGPSRLSRSAV
jgi:hypothetical protein